MKTNIFIIHESVFLLYDKMYNENICFHYILSYIMTINIVIIHESVFLLYDKMYNNNKIFSLYMKMYFFYTKRCIMKIFIVII